MFMKVPHIKFHENPSTEGAELNISGQMDGHAASKSRFWLFM
jgi:hypothetical protein